MVSFANIRVNVSVRIHQDLCYGSLTCYYVTSNDNIWSRIVFIGTVVELGARVQERRKELGLSQAMLAQRVGTTRQWIGNLEHGKRTAEVGMVLDTLRALGLVTSVRPRSNEVLTALPGSYGMRGAEANLSIRRLAPSGNEPKL